MTAYTPQTEIPKTIWFELYAGDTKVSEITLQDIRDHGWDLQVFLAVQEQTGRRWVMVVRKGRRKGDNEKL